MVASAAGLVAFGHLGWGYRDRAEFFARAAEYIVDGLDRRQRVAYVGAGSHETLRAELAAMPAVAERPDADEIKVATPSEFYALAPGAEVIDPHAALDARVAAVEDAITNGYTGVRGVADATAMARTPQQRAAFARFEFLLDQYMAEQPVSGLCAYDLHRLGHAADELICLHPYTDRRSPQFWLYAQPGTDFAVAGDLDAATDELFTTTMGDIAPLLTGDTVVIDAQNLEFIGHRQLLRLNEAARRWDKQIVMHTDEPVVARLASLLPLANVHMEHPLRPQAA